MSILQFAGFDIFPAQANAGNTLPVHGAGITGTPYAAQYPIYVSNASHLVGVSGLEIHKIGSGAKRRNGLVMYRPAGATTFAAIALSKVARLGQGAWTRTYNFTVKETSTTDIATAISLLTATVNGSSLNAYLFGLNSNKAVIVNGAAVPGVLWERNREYAIEVRLSRQASDTVNQMTLEVRMDGALIRTVNIAPISLTNNDFGVSLGPISNTDITTPRTFIFSDIIIGDDQPLGPLLVLPAQVDVVNGTGGWEKEGNADPVTSLNDRDDTTFFSSPTDDGSLSLRMKVGEDAGIPLRSSQFFIRAARDVAAGRGLVVKAENASGATIGGPSTISTTASFADYQTFNLNLSKVGDLATTAIKINAVAP